MKKDGVVRRSCGRCVDVCCCEGPPGATGPQGATGPAGSTGPEGATGPRTFGGTLKFAGMTASIAGGSRNLPDAPLDIAVAGPGGVTVIYRNVPIPYVAERDLVLERMAAFYQPPAGYDPTTHVVVVQLFVGGVAVPGFSVTFGFGGVAPSGAGTNPSAGPVAVLEGQTYEVRTTQNFNAPGDAVGYMTATISEVG